MSIGTAGLIILIGVMAITFAIYIYDKKSNPQR